MLILGLFWSKDISPKKSKYHVVIYVNLDLEEFFKKTNKEEYEIFKSLFAQEKEKFAVIKISGALLEEHEDLIAEDIAYLNKLGLYPIIVHGAGSSLDKKLASSTKINGLRVTKKEDIPIIIQTFSEIASSLCSKINSFGGKSALVEGVFECEKIQGVGEVGEIKNTFSEKIIGCVQSHSSPIISPIGNFGEDKLNINADSAAKGICKVIKPKKFILLTSTGGILDASGNLVNFLNLSSENAFSDLSGGMLVKAKEAKAVLESVPDMEVVITSPQNLLYELFTIKGKGTILKNHVLCWENNLNNLNKATVKDVIEHSFGKKLVDNYFDSDIVDVLYEKNLDGLAVIIKQGNFFYLDKFAVKKHAQGKGIGKSIWLELVKKYPSFTWRASQINPVNSFYTKHCDGLIKKGKWNIYWKGLNHEDVLSVAESISQKKSSFKEVSL